MDTDSLVQASDIWLAWAWRAALLSSAVFALLWLLRPVLRRFVSSHACSWIWLFPLIPLVTPQALPALLPTPNLDRMGLDPIGWYNARFPQEPKGLPESTNVPKAAPVPGIPADPHPTEAGASTGMNVEQITATTALEVPPQGENPKLPLRTWAVLSWWLLSAALVLLSIVRRRRFARSLQGHTQPPSPTLRVRFAKLARQMGITQPVRLRMYDPLASPVTMGCKRPQVLVPTDLIETLEPEATDWILRHELAHVRRRDLWVNAGVWWVRTLWPFHPVLWFSTALAGRERELACDEAALAATKSIDGPTAASTLLAVIGRHQKPSAPIPLGVSFLHPPSLEKKRIMNLLNDKQRRQLGLSTPALLGLFAGLVVLVPLAASHASGGPANQEPAKPKAAQGEVEPESPATLHPTEAALDVSNAIQKGLEYLILNQQENGSWLADSKKNKDMAGEFNRYGVTGLVVLALADAPDTLTIPGKELAMGKALNFLAQSQTDQTGLFNGGKRDLLTVPSHSMATLAWIRAHRKGFGDQEAYDWKAIAEKAVVGLARGANPYAGWRYGIPADGDSDSVITSMALLALGEAATAELPYPEEVVSNGFYYLASNYNQETGHFGYQKPGQQTSRIQTKSEDFPGGLVELPTAVASLAHLSSKDSPLDALELVQSATLMMGKPPVWNTAQGSTDSYYWAFATHAIQPMGGLLAERWNQSLKVALLENATFDAQGLMHWPAVDAWHHRGQEVAMTAMCVWALEGIDAP